MDKKMPTTVAEMDLWDALEMDSLSDDMTAPENAPSNQEVVGTGRTNECYQCSNSNTTHGCGGC